MCAMCPAWLAAGSWRGYLIRAAALVEGKSGWWGGVKGSCSVRVERHSRIFRQILWESIENCWSNETSFLSFSG